MVRSARHWAMVAILGIAVVAGGCSSPSSSPSGSGSGSGAATSASRAPSPTAAAAGLTGCNLVSQSEASDAEGHQLGAGREAATHLSPPFTAHSGCLYSDGTYAIGYDLNTIDTSIPVATYEQQAWATVTSRTTATQTTIGGNPGLTYAVGPQQFADFYKGQVTVVVSSANGKPGAALAVATLIAQRM